jgi:hypothetical protein
MRGLQMPYAMIIVQKASQVNAMKGVTQPQISIGREILEGRKALCQETIHIAPSRDLSELI